MSLAKGDWMTFHYLRTSTNTTNCPWFYSRSRKQLVQPREWFECVMENKMFFWLFQVHPSSLMYSKLAFSSSIQPLNEVMPQTWPGSSFLFCLHFLDIFSLSILWFWPALCHWLPNVYFSPNIFSEPQNKNPVDTGSVPHCQSNGRFGGSALVVKL